MTRLQLSTLLARLAPCTLRVDFAFLVRESAGQNLAHGDRRPPHKGARRADRFDEKVEISM